MPLHMSAWEQAVTSRGGPWNYEFFFSRKGTPERKMVELYNRQFDLSLDPADTVRYKHELFRARSHELRPVQHVLQVVRKYHGALPMAVASGGTRRNVLMQLQVLGIENCFGVVLTADDKVKPKPAPDIFLEAAKRMGIDAEYCQVFEDGDLGLEAARAAGMLATDVRQ